MKLWNGFSLSICIIIIFSRYNWKKKKIWTITILPSFFYILSYFLSSLKNIILDLVFFRVQFKYRTIAGCFFGCFILADVVSRYLDMVSCLFYSYFYADTWLIDVFPYLFYIKVLLRFQNKNSCVKKVSQSWQ